MRDKYKRLFVILGLIIAILAVFWQVHEFEFVNYDDDKYVSENAHVLSGLTFDNVIWAFTSPHFFMWHPITSLSHMLDCELFGLNSGWHHLTNLMLHIANALFLFEILRRITNRIWPSAFVAAVFAVHPLNVESVAWVCERKNVLSGFFWMLTILAYIRYAKYPRTSNYLLVIFVFSLALMSKPTTVTLPFVLLLLDYWPLGRFRWDMRNESGRLYRADSPPLSPKKLSVLQLVKEKTPLFVLSAIVCVITITTQKSGNVLKWNERFPFGIRLENALVSYISYIGKMIYPANLAVFYPHPGYSLPVWKPIVSFVVLVIVSAAVIYMGRRRPYLTVGLLWFIGTLVPVIGLVQAGSQSMADRYAYIPLVGLFIAISWGAKDLLAEWKYKRTVLGLLSVTIILILGVSSWFQLSYWRDSMSLFEHAIRVTSMNCLAYNNHGTACYKESKYDLAISDFNRALEINPRYAEAYYNRGTAYTEGKGEHDLAIADYNKAIEINPSFTEVYYNRGTAYYRMGNYNLAIADYDEAIRRNQKLFQSYFNKAAACEQTGRKKEAVEAYKAFIQYATAQYAPLVEQARQRISELEQ